jgi:hypothetical protein
MADPEQYRSREEVARWRERDPIPTFAARLVSEGVLDEDEVKQIDADAIARVDAAVAFAEASPAPAPETLYDDVYVLDGEVWGWYSSSTDADAAGLEAAAAALGPEAALAANSEIPQQLTDALAVGEDAADQQREAL